MTILCASCLPVKVLPHWDPSKETSLDLQFLLGLEFAVEPGGGIMDNGVGWALVTVGFNHCCGVTQSCTLGKGRSPGFSGSFCKIFIHPECSLCLLDSQCT